jgi:hypothetical protein
MSFCQSLAGKPQPVSLEVLAVIALFREECVSNSQEDNLISVTTALNPQNDYRLVNWIALTVEKDSSTDALIGRYTTLSK